MKGLIPRLNIHYSLSDALNALKYTFTSLPYSTADCFYLNHARTGLRIALSALNLPLGSKIGIMAFNCFTVMNAVKLAGYKIEFIDITDDFTIDFNDLQKKSKSLNAIIVTHLFGIQNDINKIRDICFGMPLIEDCAHSFLSQTDGKYSGSFGDMAVFSMGLGKCPSIGKGGYLVINNHKYYEAVLHAFNNLSIPSVISEFAGLINNLVLSILHNSFIYGVFTKPVLKEKKNDQRVEAKFDNFESKILNSSLGLFLSKQGYFPKWKEKQQSNASQLINALKKSFPMMHIPADIHFNSGNCFMLPVLYDEREHLKYKLQKMGVEIGPHFAKSIEWAVSFGYLYGNCKNAEKISKNILVFPCHYNLSEKNLTQIIESIKKLSNE